MAIAGGRWRGGNPIGCALCVHLLAGLLAAFGLPALPASAVENAPPDKLPRFVSLRSDDVNLRIGPGQSYPIEWVLTRKDMPVEIVEEFQNWRKIRLWQDTSGWVLDRMVTAERHVLVAGAVRILYRRPDRQSEVVARAEPGVLARLVACRGDWCEIAPGGYQGWLKRGEVWGVLPGETLP